MLRALGLCLAATLVLGAPACNHEKKKPPAPSALLDQALKEQTAGHADAAERLLHQVIEADPGNVTAHYNLGVIYQGRGDNTRALAEYGLALTSDPKYVPAMFNEATIYAVTDPPLAVSTYKRIVSIQPKAPTAYLNLGLLEIGLKDEDAGLRHLKIALEQDPSLLDRLTPEVKTKLAKLTPSPTAKP